MGELIELSYCRFSRHVIIKLIRARNLLSSERHKMSAVTSEWARFRQDVARRVGDRNEPPGTA